MEFPPLKLGLWSGILDRNARYRQNVNIEED